MRGNSTILAVDYIPELDYLVASFNDRTICCWDTDVFALRQRILLSEMHISLLWCNPK